MHDDKGVKIKENKKKDKNKLKKCRFSVVTNKHMYDDICLKEVLELTACLGSDPDDFIKIIPEKKISNSVYLNVSHPLVGTAEVDKYLLEIRFEKDKAGEFMHFEILTGDEEYVINTIKKYFKKCKLPSLKLWNDVTGRFLREMYVSDVIDAHRFSSNHRLRLENDAKCGCFYCGHIFSPKEITEWIDDPLGTAVCPYCGIDAVIGQSSGYPITEEFLLKMKKYWFF